MEIKDLLGLRKKTKSKKPDFVRQDFHKKSGLKRKWRRPKGLHSKLRLKIKGKGKPVSQGYRSPKKVKHLHYTGLEEKAVSSLKDFNSLDAKNHVIIIPSLVGKRKKIEVLKKAKMLGIKVTNIRNPDEYLKEIEENLERKKKAKELKEKKETRTKEKKKEEELAEKVEDENKKDTEKKEKDKVLTKRDR